MQLGQHWVIITFLGFFVGFAMLFCIYSFCGRVGRNGVPMSMTRLLPTRILFYRQISQKDADEDRHLV